MANNAFADGITGNRLDPQEYDRNFADLHAPLDKHEALVASDRCYFCYDAPCTKACPTEIDIPMFIRQIQTDNPLGAAKTIFDQNILGGMCARVCPTETLCEEACVRMAGEGKPVEIGRLQRYATDIAMEQGRQFYERAAETGKSVAVVGAGPAGLAAAHRLAMHGHSVTIYDAKPKPGGLNEYGIATYKTTNNFAQSEVDYVLGIGGIEVRTGQKLGRDITLAELKESHDAVFLGIGLAGVNDLDVKHDDADGADDAVSFIAGLRQARDKADVPVGRKVVVIGGGMTAIDAAVQSKLLGAETVTVVYRRGRDRMNASPYEQDLAASKGVNLRFNLMPKKVLAKKGRVTGIELEYTAVKDGKLEGTGETVKLECDQILKAIGQAFEPDAVGGKKPSLALEKGRIKVDGEGRTSMTGVWAGGDCILGGEDLTVTAVAQGRDAAESIHRALAG
ncbi:MAG: NAD(P)-dependent oxidoreductase [Rhizobiaceae bacterium]|nr:NAD(P)-dependent oxidoreductase [Rhizobiaceae bacterium]